jgi:phosphoesterase RecJ-like protein
MMLNPDIPTLLKNEDRFVVVSHTNPDGDAIGSLLGMYLALKEMGKTVWALTEKEFPQLYAFLPGAGDVLTEPHRIQSPDWIIVLDVADKPRIAGDISAFEKNTKLINIDHHPTNPAFGDVNFIDTSATSTAELVFRVLKDTGYALSMNVGKCLYTGLVTDTGCFRFSGVNSNTMRIAAEMLDTGFESYEITRRMFEEFPLARLKLERLVLDRAEILIGGRLVLSILKSDDFTRLGADMSDAENLVNRLREYQGVQAAILITDMEDGLVRVSLRSKDALDVSAIAQSLGGGGHKYAAGIKSKLPVSELKERLVRAVGEAFELANFQ